MTAEAIVVRVDTLEKRQDEDRDEIRSLKNWIMGTLAAACGGLIVQVIALLSRKP